MNFHFFFRKFQNLFSKYWKKIIFVIFCLTILNFSISVVTGVNLIETGFKNFLTLFTGELPNNEVRFNSDNWSWDNVNSNMGEWGIIKSAEWTSKETARITFEVQTGAKTSSNKKDIVLVLDTSSTMSDKQFEALKEASVNMVEQVLGDGTAGNQVALVSYNKSASILSDLSTDKETLSSKINGLRTTVVGRNYAAALRGVRQVLDGYIEDSSRDLMALFVANGMASEEAPTQFAEYSILKDKYSKIKIKGISYIKNDLWDLSHISDTALIKTSENNISNELLKASLMAEEVYSFNKFKITDYINNNFTLLNKDQINESIKADIGTIKHNNTDSSIEWDLSNENFAGKNIDSGVKLTIDLRLKIVLKIETILQIQKKTLK